MKVLIVVADQSLDHLVTAAETAVQEAGHEITVVDLHGENFAPYMSRAEREAYESDNPIISDDVARYANLVRESEALVFIYATTWGGVPPLLKGWLERVFVPTVAFVLDEKTNKVKPALRHVRRLVGIATYDQTWRHTKLVNDAGRRTIARGMRLIVSRRCRTTWLARYRGGDDEAFERRVRRKLARL